MSLRDMMSAYDNSMTDLKDKSILPNNMTGRSSTGFLPDEDKMLFSGIAGAADIGMDIYSAAKTNSQMKKFGEEDRNLAEITRLDELKRNKDTELLRKKSLELEEKQFENNKFVDSQNLRHEMFVQEFKRSVESRRKLVEAFTSLKGDTSKNADIRNIILSSFRRNK